jgi:hypothetical protein
LKPLPAALSFLRESGGDSADDDDRRLVVKTRLIALLIAAMGLVAAIVAEQYSGRIDDATFYAVLLMVDHHAERAGFKF